MKHSCDEKCQCCEKCYSASGLEICGKLCKHAGTDEEEEEFVPYGSINGVRVSDEEFWDYVHKHAKLDENGNPVMTVTKVDKQVH